MNRKKSPSSFNYLATIFSRSEIRNFKFDSSEKLTDNLCPYISSKLTPIGDVRRSKFISLAQKAAFFTLVLFIGHLFIYLF